MAHIVTPLTDILTQLGTLDVTNQDSSVTKLYARVWNNQIRYEADGKLYDFPKPAAFIEIVSPATFEILGQGYRSCDVNFRVHLTHENYNNEGTFEQDLLIFDLRDKVIQLLTAYRPSGCGPLNCMAESQDFEHSNTYHYILDFVTNFTDDTAKWLFIEKAPPTDVEFDIATRNITQPTLYTVEQGRAYTTSYQALANGERSFLILDQNGNKIIGANIVTVIKEIKTLTPSMWSWDAGTSNLTLLSDQDGPISLSAGESVFIIFQQNLG